MYEFVASLLDEDFEIVFGFPPTVLAKDQSLEQAGLCPKAVVHVRECLNNPS